MCTLLSENKENRAEMTLETYFRKQKIIIITIIIPFCEILEQSEKTFRCKFGDMQFTNYYIIGQQAFYNSYEAS